MELEDNPINYQSDREIKNKLYAVIRSTASTDVAMLNVAKYGVKALPRVLVYNTWKKIAILDEQGEGGARALVGPVGVLVGSGLAQFLGLLLQDASPSPTQR